jgi:hypothetical protein
VLSVGITVPGITVLALNWNVPVIAGLLKELVAVAVMVMLSPRLIFMDVAVSDVVVGYTTETLTGDAVAAA